MSSPKFKARFNFGAFLMFLLSFIFLLSCYLTYSLIPESDSFTNSIDVSGEETVIVFTLVPVLGVVSCVVFVVFLVIFRKYYAQLALADNKFGNKIISSGIIRASSYVSSFVLLALLVISTCFAFSLLSEFKFLGFVAPVSDTVYESYEKFILADCVIHFVFLILTSLKMSGFSLTDAVAKIFIKKEKKS